MLTCLYIATNKIDKALQGYKVIYIHMPNLMIWINTFLSSASFCSFYVCTLQNKFNILLWVEVLNIQYMVELDRNRKLLDRVGIGYMFNML